MVCPIWNGVDTAGRDVCPDSFMTKRAGCNSADDRVVVENNLRPQYLEYINLNANGIGGHIYRGGGGHSKEGFTQSDGRCPAPLKGPYGNTSSQNNAHLNTQVVNNVHNITGSFGEQFEATRRVMCSVDAYKKSMCQAAQAQRQQGAANNNFHAHQNMNAAGM